MWKDGRGKRRFCEFIRKNFEIIAEHSNGFNFTNRTKIKKMGTMFCKRV